MNSNHKHRTFQTLLYILAIFGVSAGIYNALRMLNVLTPTVHAQQDPFLERRISQIEQRYSFIETRISRLEQESRFPARLPDSGGAIESELRLLRAQMETMQLRLGEAECGLVKLDERTLSVTARQNRRKQSPGEGDVCRAEPDAAIRLSARP
jgi:hypothetical protein